MDPLIDEFSIKDGGPIPLLQMTYINKTTPKPCDKEVKLISSIIYQFINAISFVLTHYNLILGDIVRAE